MTASTLSWAAVDGGRSKWDGSGDNPAAAVSWRDRGAASRREGRRKGRCRKQPHGVGGCVARLLSPPVCGVSG